MNRKINAKTMIILMAACCFFIAPTQAQDNIPPEAEGKKINIDFKSEEGEGMTLKMALPLSLIASAAPQIETMLQQVKQEKNIDIQDIWNSLKDAGPTELVSIDSQDMKMKVFSTETELNVMMNEKKEGQEILVSIPLELVDAIFSDNTEIDYNKIIKALLKMEGKDLVKVDSADMKGRVWID